MHSLARLHALLACCLLALAASSALAQGDPPKSCEQRLREAEEKIRILENRAKDYQREIQRLRGEVEAAKGGGRGPGTGAPPAPTPKKTEAPEQPLASPDSLLSALIADYNTKVATLPRESRSEQSKYQKAAREWTAEAAKNFRGPVDWTIRVASIEGEGRAAQVVFDVLDGGGQPMGQPTTLPFAFKYMKDLSSGVGTKTFKLAGTVNARPAFNAQRAEQGSDDEPLFVGPFVEFAFDLAVQSLTEIP